MNENRTIYRGEGNCQSRICSAIQAAASLTRLGEGASRSLNLLLLRRLPLRLTKRDVAAGSAL